MNIGSHLYLIEGDSCPQKDFLRPFNRLWMTGSCWKASNTLNLRRFCQLCFLLCFVRFCSFGLLWIVRHWSKKFRKVSIKSSTWFSIWCCLVVGRTGRRSLALIPVVDKIHDCSVKGARSNRTKTTSSKTIGVSGIFKFTHLTYHIPNVELFGPRIFRIMKSSVDIEVGTVFSRSRDWVRRRFRGCHQRDTSVFRGKRGWDGVVG